MSRHPERRSMIDFQFGYRCCTGRVSRGYLGQVTRGSSGGASGGPATAQRRYRKHSSMESMELSLPQGAKNVTSPVPTLCIAPAMTQQDDCSTRCAEQPPITLLRRDKQA